MILMMMVCKMKDDKSDLLAVEVKFIWKMDDGINEVFYKWNYTNRHQTDGEKQWKGKRRCHRERGQRLAADDAAMTISKKKVEDEIAKRLETVCGNISSLSRKSSKSRWEIFWPISWTSTMELETLEITSSDEWQSISSTSNLSTTLGNCRTWILAAVTMAVCVW